MTATYTVKLRNAETAEWIASQTDGNNVRVSVDGPTITFGQAGLDWYIEHNAEDEDGYVDTDAMLMWVGGTEYPIDESK